MKSHKDPIAVTGIGVAAVVVYTMPEQGGSMYWADF